MRWSGPVRNPNPSLQSVEVAAATAAPAAPRQPPSAELSGGGGAHSSGRRVRQLPPLCALARDRRCVSEQQMQRWITNIYLVVPFGPPAIPLSEAAANASQVGVAREPLLFAATRAFSLSEWPRWDKKGWRVGWGWGGVNIHEMRPCASDTRSIEYAGRCWLNAGHIKQMTTDVWLT